jgi:hypothetical protein
VGNDYGRHYSEVLEPLRGQPIRLLEIGVGDGKSIRVWLDYFTHPNSYIVGVDIDNISRSEGRYTFHQIDQTDALGLQRPASSTDATANANWRASATMLFEALTQLVDAERAVAVHRSLDEILVGFSVESRRQ